MPRIYKPDPHGKRYKKYSNQVIEQARNAVVRGNSIRAVSRDLGVPYSVLQRHIRKRDIKKQGGQTVLSSKEEAAIVQRLQVCAEWGYPMDLYDLRVVVKGYLDGIGKTVPKFKDNMPGYDFAKRFMIRHKEKLAERFCQNIKRARAKVSPETINNFFDNLEQSISGIPPSNIVNFDETNLSNDPGRSKIITKRGCKYPERVMNSTKSAVSVMFAVSGDGNMLPCYIVYKAKGLYSTWKEGAPKGTRFSCSQSGWFDSIIFDDWVKTIAIPHLKKLPGKKILIGDNLSSHLSIESIKACQNENISFVFLPSNSTHLTQPLDIAFFRPLKTAWRSILLQWRKGPGMNESSLPKSEFPRLFSRTLKKLEENAAVNIKSGFRKAGIIPLDRTQVLNSIPQESQLEDNAINQSVERSFLNILQDMRYGNSQETKRQAKKKLKVVAGQSVGVESESDSDSDNENKVVSEALEAELDRSDEDEHDSISDAENYDCSNQLHVEKFGRKFDHVQQVSETNIQVGDWLLVSFTPENKRACSSKMLYYICEVTKTVGRDTEFEGNFLRGKNTRDCSGYIYHYPEVEDRSCFEYCQVIGKLEEPEKNRRGDLKFKVNFHYL